jgi:hypothetical protein
MGIAGRIRGMANDIDANLERQRLGLPVPPEVTAKIARRWWVFLLVGCGDLVLLALNLVLAEQAPWFRVALAIMWGLQVLYFVFFAGFAFNNRLRQQGRLVGGFRNSFSVYEPSPGQSDDE